MPAHRQSRLAATAAVCVAVALSLGAAAPAGAQDTSSKVRVATTGNRSELVKTLPISRVAGAEPRVAMSMSPQQLPALRTSDQLEVSAEVEVTTDCLPKNADPDCVGKPYDLNPKVGASLVLASTPSTASGLPVSARQEIICRQKLPNRQHHCMIVLAPPPVQIDEALLPCPSNGCYLNLVMDAHHSKRRARNVLLVGANNRNGNVVQDKGRVNAIRTRPGGNPPQVPPPPPTGTHTVGTGERMTTAIGFDPPNEAVLYSLPMEGLQDGEQLAVKAGATVDVSTLEHNANVSTRVLLTDDPLMTDPGVVGGAISELNGEITENNGYNCTRKTTPCNTVKRGVLEIKQNAPQTLYVNVVLNIARVGGSSPPGTFLTITETGGLEVTRYPAVAKD